jgi:hypothetical protein
MIQWGEGVGIDRTTHQDGLNLCEDWGFVPKGMAR